MDRPALGTPRLVGRLVATLAMVLLGHVAPFAAAVAFSPQFGFDPTTAIFSYVALSLLCLASLWLAFGPDDSGWRQFFFALLVLTSVVWLVKFPPLFAYLWAPLLIAVVGKHWKRKGLMALGFRPDPPRRRGTWQFSLKYLFALTAAVAVTLLVGRIWGAPLSDSTNDMFFDLVIVALIGVVLASLLLVEFTALGLVVLRAADLSHPVLGILFVTGLWTVLTTILWLMSGSFLLRIVALLSLIYGPYAVLFAGSFYLLRRAGLCISTGAPPKS